ncbi:hypothetical protein [Glutamicibacter sp.]|uniref:hypothetical protein n=1 Tax=Glutamicibacter sp. TaxID=1931995 RepID=UPI002FC98CB5
MATSSNQSLQGGDQEHTLVAALTLFFEEPQAQQAEAKVRELLAAREVISLVSVPVPWNGLAMIEASLAVNHEGLLLLAGAAGAIRLGQQVEDFALALKLGTGALYIDQDDAEVQTGEPIEDPRLDAMPPGRTVAIGALNEPDMGVWAAASKTSWQLLPPESAGAAVAVHEGFLVGGVLAASQHPAIMLSRTGARFTASFWFEKQPAKLGGHPAWVHIWPVAASPAFWPQASTPARRELDWLLANQDSVDGQELDELAGLLVDAEHIERLKQALVGTGSLQSAQRVLETFGHPPDLARYLDDADLPEGARWIEPVSMARAVGRALIAESRTSGARRRWYNSLSWKPAAQLALGLIEALVFSLVLAATHWQQPWAPPWVIVLLLVLGSVDATGNTVLGAVRWFRARRRR